MLRTTLSIIVSILVVAAIFIGMMMVINSYSDATFSPLTEDSKVRFDSTVAKLVVVETTAVNGHSTQILCDVDTGILYLCDDSYNRGALTPLYDADGSFKTYDEYY